VTRCKPTGCNSSKPLLSSSIPNLQFDPFAIKFNCPYLKVNAESKHVYYPIKTDNSNKQKGKHNQNGIFRKWVICSLELQKLTGHYTVHKSISSAEKTYPMVVMKLVVKDPSEKRRRRQLLPTPEKWSVVNTLDTRICHTS